MNFIVPLHIYPVDVFVSLDEADSVLFERLEKNGLKEDDKINLMVVELGGLCYEFADNKIVIRLTKQPTTYETTGLVAHECYHATVCIMSSMGIPICEQTEEAFAYTLGYLTSEIAKKLKI